MNKTFKKIFIALLLFGILLTHLNLGEEKIEIDEEDIKKTNPLNYLTWKTGYFQDNFIQEFKDRFSENSFLTKLRNQLDFSFFSKTHVSNLVLGNNEYLFNSEEIDEFTGANFIGDNYIKQKLDRLQYINDKLEIRNKKLIVVLSPSKAYFHAKNIKQTSTEYTNYKRFAAQLKNYDVTYLDFNNLLYTSKKNSFVFNKTDDQLAQPKAMYLLDSLLNRSSKKLEVTFPKLMLEDTLVITDTSHLANPLNLLFPAKKEDKITSVYFEGKGNLNKRITCVGDNSFTQLFESNFISETFGKGSFWLNGKEVFESGDITFSKTLEPSEFPKEIDESDVLLLVVSPKNLDHLGNGLVDYLYDYYAPEGGTPVEYSEYEQYCYAVKQKILQNTNHKQLIYTQANKKGLNYYDNIRGHAIYEISQLDKSWSYESEKISDYEAQSILAKNNILKNPNLKKKTFERAKRMNWSVFFTLDLDALDIIENADKQGYSSVRDVYPPLHLAILEMENKIILDSAWSAIVKKQSMEQNISFEKSLWKNAEYTVWLKTSEFIRSLDESAQWVNNLYFKNELLKRKEWMEKIILLAKEDDKNLDHWTNNNVEYLTYINRKVLPKIELEEALILQHQLEIRKDKNWMKIVAKDAKKNAISLEASLRKHAEYVRFLRKQEEASN